MIFAVWYFVESSLGLVIVIIVFVLVVVVDSVIYGYEWIPTNTAVFMDLYCLYSFVDDIACGIADDVSVQLFADDTKIHTVIDSVNLNTGQLQHSHELLVSWADRWQLELSPTKCGVVGLNP